MAPARVREVICDQPRDRVIQSELPGRRPLAAQKLLAELRAPGVFRAAAPKPETPGPTQSEIISSEFPSGSGPWPKAPAPGERSSAFPDAPVSYLPGESGPGLPEPPAAATQDVSSPQPGGQPPIVFAPPSGASSPIAAVPEPASWVMLILGVAGLGGALRSRRRSSRSSPTPG
jgi:hypothetical protein